MSSFRSLVRVAARHRGTFHRAGAFPTGVRPVVRPMFCYQENGHATESADSLALEATFSTLTNVNFSAGSIADYIARVQAETKNLQEQLAGVSPPSTWTSAPVGKHPAVHSVSTVGDDVDALRAEGERVVVHGDSRQAALGETIAGLHELITCGIKGLAAYAHHAERLGQTDTAIPRFVYEGLSLLSSPQATDVDALLGKAMECGAVNVRALELLDKGHRDRFGVPTPSSVSLRPKPGKAILVSGHDMATLEDILRATADTGINVYTHGEMLPAHSYPGLKKYPHLAGHYGGPWQLQRMEFSRFPGAIILTTNCLQPPRRQYEGRLFTTGPTAHDGVQHLADGEYDALIAAAQAAEGFTSDESTIPLRNGKETLEVGFGHETILSVAPQIIDAVTEGKLRHVFVVGGCDGSESERSYYTELAEQAPQDTLVLTLGCGKYRLNHLDMGNLPGTSIPRLLDMGQCNDSYGAVVVANALASAFKTDINGLPLSLALSWFEQKAVAVLLSLLHLGVQNIRVGPRLPAFVTPDALAVLQSKFQLKPTAHGQTSQDLASMMAKA